MRSVMTFWQMPPDEAAFFEYLSREEVIVYPSGDRATEAELTPMGLADYVRERSGTRCLLSLRSLQSEIRVEKQHRDEQNVFVIQPTRSSVLDYAPGVLHDGTLAITNIFAFWDVLQDDTLVNKSDQFRAWGKTVFKWLRKRMQPLHQGNSFQMTIAAEEAVLAGVKLTE